MITIKDRYLIYKELKAMSLARYDNLCINKNGVIYSINPESGEYSKVKKIYKINNIPVYELTDFDGNINIEYADRLLMETHYGSFPADIINSNGQKLNINNLKYDIKSIEYVSDNIVLVNNIEFRRVLNDKNTKLFISKNGMMFSSFKNGFCKFQMDKSLYLRINLISIHREVYKVWVNPDLDDSMHVNHINSRRNNNYLKNLEEVTPLENQRHAMKYGNANSQYTEDIIRKICEFMESNLYKPSEIAHFLNMKTSVVNSIIQNIKAGRIWADIASEYDIEAYKNSTHRKSISDEIIHEICKLLKDGYTAKSIGRMIGIDASYVNDIRNGKARTDIGRIYGFSSNIIVMKEERSTTIERIA